MPRPPGSDDVIYLANATTPKVREAMAAGLIGQLRQPDDGHLLVPGAIWAADNGCFNPRRFTIRRWARWLDAQPRTALWATVPDVVGDHAATLRRWHRLARFVAEAGFPPAFVAQDGCTPAAIPTDAACVFLGGTTEWKLSPAAQAVATEAKRRDLFVHMGRVNSRRRLRIAASWGCDSVDGTYLVFGPDVNLPKLLGWLHPEQPSLFGGVA